MDLRLGCDNLGRIDAALDGVPVRVEVARRREVRPPREAWSASCRQVDDRLRLRVSGPPTETFATFRCTVYGPFEKTWHEHDRSSGAYLANLQPQFEETYLWPVQFEPIQADYPLPGSYTAEWEALVEEWDPDTRDNRAVYLAAVQFTQDGDGRYSCG